MFIRDSKTNAIINNDDSYYKSILHMRKAEKQNLAALTQVSALEKELTEIRDLVNILIQTKGK